MNKLRSYFLPCVCMLFAMSLLVTGCGSNAGSGAASTGKVTVSLTDAPAISLEHVWVTVKEIRFHKSDLCDDPDDGGWLRYPLATPVTLDLTALNNGIWNTLWDGILLPVGDYQQIRVILEGTSDPLALSAASKGLIYNNQVNNNGSAFPLIVPAAKNGIKLIGSFRVTSTTPLHIVVDFDVTHDVVETGSGNYILKPRLKYFVVSTPQTAAITGKVYRPDGTAFANYTGVKVLIKAEAAESITFANTSTIPVMGIKRSTTVRSDGTFALYPLPASAGKTYDLVVRGTGIQTMILRGVPAEPGTTRDDPSMLAIDLRPGNEYLVSSQVVNANTNPYEPAIGASVGFYQTLPGLGEIPYLIRFRDVNPFYGTFGNFPLASGKLLVGTYNPLVFIQSFTGVDPQEGPNSYAAYAFSPFFWPSGPKGYSPVTTFNRFLLAPQAFAIQPDCDMDNDGEIDSHPDKGYYVVRGGLIVDHIRKQDLEQGRYEFQSVDVNGKNLQSHGKGDKVDLSKHKPVKIKFKK